MLEDLDDIIQLLNHEVHLTCLERHDGGLNQCVQIQRPSTAPETPDAELEPEPEHSEEPEHGGSGGGSGSGGPAQGLGSSAHSGDKWTVTLWLRPDCFALIDEDQLHRLAEKRAEQLPGAQSCYSSPQSRVALRQSRLPTTGTVGITIPMGGSGVGTGTEEATATQANDHQTTATQAIHGHPISTTAQATTATQATTAQAPPGINTSRKSRIVPVRTHLLATTLACLLVGTYT
jgi:hypothetical protein